jgi:acyltransferase-like protein
MGVDRRSRPSCDRLVALWHELLAGPVFYHLWYVYMLLGLYLAIPLLRPLASHATPTLRWYALGLWFVGTAVLPLWAWWGGPSIGIPVLVVSTYVGYLLAGTWLAAQPLSRRTAWELLLLFLLAAVWTIVATARLTGDEHVNVILYSYDRPNVVVMALVAFVLLTEPQLAAWVARHPATLVTGACIRSLELRHLSAPCAVARRAGERRARRPHHRCVAAAVLGYPGARCGAALRVARRDDGGETGAGAGTDGGSLRRQ